MVYRVRLGGPGGMGLEGLGNLFGYEEGLGEISSVGVEVIRVVADLVLSDG